MGDRISISFRKDGNESVVLFNHWGGRAFLGVVEKYLEELDEELKTKKYCMEYTPFGYQRFPVESVPLGRRQPNTIMVDFIRWLTSGESRVI